MSINISIAYKGYLISPVFASDQYHISKEGQHISYAKSIVEAKIIIDENLISD